METQNKSEKTYQELIDEAVEQARMLFEKLQEAKRLHKQFSQQNKQPEQDGSGME